MKFISTRSEVVREGRRGGEMSICSYREVDIDDYHLTTLWDEFVAIVPSEEVPHFLAGVLWLLGIVDDNGMRACHPPQRIP